MNHVSRLAMALGLASALLAACAKHPKPALPAEEPDTTTEVARAHEEPLDTFRNEDVKPIWFAGGLPIILFDFDKSNLRPDQAERLHVLADRAKGPCVIEGQTDTIGTTDYNLSLGMSRAEAVADYLRHAGCACDPRATSAGEERAQSTPLELDRKAVTTCE